MQLVDLNPYSRQHGNPWDSDEEDTLWLLTPEEVGNLQPGVVLTSITDRTKMVGRDDIDLDTRFGYTAWGLRESQIVD